MNDDDSASIDGVHPQENNYPQDKFLYLIYITIFGVTLLIAAWILIIFIFRANIPIEKILSDISEQIVPADDSLQSLHSLQSSQSSQK